MSKELKVCPVCNKEYAGEPSLSRKDNKTDICPDCGQQEAMDAMTNSTKEKVKFNFKDERYTIEDCIDIDTIKDCTGMILVLKPSALNAKYRESKYQLWKATGGFGTKNFTIGTAVFARSLYDNEECRWARYQFLGALKDGRVKELYGEVPIPDEELFSKYKEEVNNG